MRNDGDVPAVKPAKAYILPINGCSSSIKFALFDAVTCLACPLHITWISFRAAGHVALDDLSIKALWKHEQRVGPVHLGSDKNRGRAVLNEDPTAALPSQEVMP